jgi:hypothetical protein
MSANSQRLLKQAAQERKSRDAAKRKAEGRTAPAVRAARTSKHSAARG